MPQAHDSPPPIDHKKFIGHHAYANEATLYFLADITADKIHTVRIEGCIGNNVTRNWKNKTQLQLTTRDVSQVAACMAGYIPSITLKNYGAAKNKSIQISNQAEKTYICLLEGTQKPIAVPVFAQDRFFILGIFIRQLQLNMPWLTTTDILQILKLNYSNRAVTKQ